VHRTKREASRGAPKLWLCSKAGGAQDTVLPHLIPGQIDRRKTPIGCWVTASTIREIQAPFGPETSADAAQ